MGELCRSINSILSPRSLDSKTRSDFEITANFPIYLVAYTFNILCLFLCIVSSSSASNCSLALVSHNIIHTLDTAVLTFLLKFQLLLFVVSASFVFHLHPCACT